MASSEEAFEAALDECESLLVDIPQTDGELIDFFASSVEEVGVVTTLVERAAHPQDFAWRCLSQLAARLAGGTRWSESVPLPTRLQHDREDQPVRDAVSAWLRGVAMTNLPGKGSTRQDHTRDMVICALVQMVVEDFGLPATGSQSRVDRKGGWKGDLESDCRIGGSACHAVTLALHRHGQSITYKNVERIWGRRKKVEANASITHRGLRKVSAGETRFAVLVAFLAMRRASPKRPERQ